MRAPQPAQGEAARSSSPVARSAPSVAGLRVTRVAAICSVEECERSSVARGWCDPHYRRWLKHGDPVFVRFRPARPDECSVEGCADAPESRGWCSRHYARWRRHGSTELPPKPSLSERFWAKVDQNGPAPESRPELGSCWLWTAARFRPVRPGAERWSYGAFGPERETAHRVAYELTFGAIPTGIFLAHLCDNSACVRPEHLVARGTSDVVRHRRRRRGSLARDVASNARTSPARQVRGERHPGARLTEEDVREIRRRDEGQSSLAREFGVSQGLISRIKRRDLWAHLE